MTKAHGALGLQTVESLMDGEKASLHAVEQRLRQRHSSVEETSTIRFLYAFLLLNEGRVSSAAKHFWRVRKESPLLADYASYYLAKANSQRDRLEDARGGFKKLIKKYPRSPVIPLAVMDLAQIEESIGNFALAAKNYEFLCLRKEEKEESKATACLKAADISLSLGVLDRANKIYHYLLIQHPTSEAALSLEGRKIPPLSVPDAYARALNLMTKQDFKKSLQILDELLDKEIPSYPVHREEILLKKAEILFLSREYKDSEKILVRLLKTPFASEAAWKLAWTYQRLGRADKAAPLFLRVYNESPLLARREEALYRAALSYNDNENYKEAEPLFLKLIGDHPQSSYVGAVYWKLAWNAFSRQDYEKSAELWARILTDQNYLDSSRYWLGRTFVHLKKPEEANIHFTKLIKDSPFSYYALLARNYLKIPLAPNMNKKSSPAAPKTSKLKRGRVLTDLGLKNLAILELKNLSDANLKSNDEKLELAFLLNQNEQYHAAASIIEEHFSSFRTKRLNPNDLLWKLAYPRVFYEKLEAICLRHSLDPLLIFSLIRAESVYSEEALSNSGAVGLMQIIPPTGKEIATQLKVQGFDKKSLYDPEINLEFGIFYFAQLSRKFANPLFAIPSYNAGPRKIEQWLGKAANKPFDIFVEDIPFQETRDYWKRVLKNYAIYQYLYREKFTYLKIEDPRQPVIETAMAPL